MDFRIVSGRKAMAMEIPNDYISRAMQSMAKNHAAATGGMKDSDRAKASGYVEKYADQAAKGSENNRTGHAHKADLAAVYTSSVRNQSQRLADYARELAKLAPSVQMRVGTTIPSGRSGKTLTINPALLNKMQHDPKQAQDTKDMIKGVEFITKFVDGLYKSTGKVLLYRHSYIDAEGKYRCFSRVKDVRGEKMSATLRKQRQKNSQNLIAKTKANAVKKRKQAQNLQAKARTKARAGTKVNIRL